MASRYRRAVKAADTTELPASRYSWKIYRYADPERIESRIDIASGAGDDWWAVIRQAERAAGWDRERQALPPASVPRDLVLTITRTDTGRTTAMGLI